MSSRTKKLLLALGFIAFIAVIGAMIYYIFFKPIISPPAVTPEEEAPGVPGYLPPAGEAVPTVPAEEAAGILPSAPEIPPYVSEVASGSQTVVTTLTETTAYSPTLSSDGENIVYYDKADNKFYRITPDGQKTALSDKLFYDVEKVDWAPDKNKTILEYPDGSKIYYDFSTGKQVSLYKHWNDFSFSPDSEEIAFKSEGIDPSNRWLAVADPDGSNTRAIEPLGENGDKVQIAWSPNDQIVATSRTGKPQGSERQEILFIGMNKENFKSTIVEGWGFDYEWTPDGKKILYSVYNGASDYKPVLWMVGAQGDDIGSGRKSLQLNTWVDKCTVVDASSAYCAVPQEMQTGAGLQPNVNDNIPDSIYKIDLQSGSKTLMAIPYGDYTVEQIMVSEDEDYLYFTDKSTGRLHKINLK